MNDTNKTDVGAVANKGVEDYSVSDIDLESLYEEVELDDAEDLGGFDDDSLAPIAAVPGKSKREKLWLGLTILFLILAIALSFILPSAISVQKQRVDHIVEIIDKVNLTNISAAQALTHSGRFDGVKKNLSATKASVDKLVSPQQGLSGLTSKVFKNGDANASIKNVWSKYKKATDEFIEGEEKVNNVKRLAVELDGAISATISDSVGFVEVVAKEGRNKSGGSSKDKYLFLTSEASNLNGILSRLSASMRGYFNYNPELPLSELSSRQNNFMVRLQETLGRIVTNSATVVGSAAEPLKARYTELEAQVASLGEQAVSVVAARESLTSLSKQSTELSKIVNTTSNQSSIVNLMSKLSLILPVIFGLLGLFSLWRYINAQTKELVEHDADLEETLADQQESILKLLDEMSALADGDLTVEAEVTDQITGAIADSVNFAVMEMRELVTQINSASVQVANESERAVGNAQAVSASNIAQAEKIASAAQMMEEVTKSMREMSEQANSSSEMAAESIKVATQGTQAVRDTIKGMDDMREQIQDTSKRIKRLGESSQRIGDIVALIDDIAEQTNILSLNAAIQASMAGEAGRGFAVVSDEVQGLAERSTEATKKIAELVTTIQNDTNDAVLSMEKATQQVVSGTKVADSAGAALSEIEEVSQRLSSLVEGISKGSNEQAEVVTQVSDKVSMVSQESTDTSRKAQDSANSIAKLLELAKDLETSVSRFKLPSN